MSLSGRRETDPYFTTGGAVSLGIDVSHYQGAIDWSTVAQTTVPGHRDDRVRFAFVRIGDGISIDRSFERNFRGAGDAGIPRGTYRYFRAREGGVRVAQLDAAAIERAGGFGLGDLRPAVDLEVNAANDASGQQGAIEAPRVLAEARAYLEEIERLTGRKGLVYSGAYVHGLALALRRAPDELTGWPIWSPAYTPDARVPHGWDRLTFWQFTSNGRVRGIPNEVDLNYFRGSPLELDLWRAASVHVPFGCGAGS